MSRSDRGGYAPRQVTETTGAASLHIINRNVTYATTDWQASIDELQALCPNLKAVSLVVSWFGTDLRAGNCRVMPGVEVSARANESQPWQVSGIARGDAHLVSRVNGAPAYGGTPNDAAVLAAIADLKARGLKVTLYPLIMMDIPAGNGLPDPYGGAEQALYPWRGRITSTGDRTAVARSDVAAFCGSASPAAFSISGGAVVYSGSEQSYRRMVLHYAKLATLAGGVDAFIIGSEMRGLSRLRDDNGAFPFVGQLVALAADVRSILGAGTKLTYAADWSEYFGYHPDDGSGDVYFHLDPLWASADIDAVGIDNYMPLSDWRDADLLEANPDGARTADDETALQAAIAAGEGFDWYYRNDTDRTARVRSGITDGLAGKPWVFRFKDIESWWSNRHNNRQGGSEAASPTAWSPGMKPVWFTELGCPAIDRGANQPNVFVDPKSAESAYPYFSGGQRSDCMQRRFLGAHLTYWNSAAAPAGMVDPEDIRVWTWDARPHPAFPYDGSLFADGPNWQTGHWLNGRLGAGTLPEVIAAILADNGFADYDVGAVSGDLTGYVQAGVMSPRQLIEPLLAAFQIDCCETGGKLVFSSRAKISNPARKITVLADMPGEPLWETALGQESDFATEVTLDYADEAADYENAVARSRRIVAGNTRVSPASMPGVLSEAQAAEAAEESLRDQRIARRSLSFRIAPFDLSPEPGDTIALDGLPGRFRITRISDGETRKIEAVDYAPPLGGRVFAATPTRLAGSDISAGFAPWVTFMDLPKIGSKAAEAYASAAVLARPWRVVSLASSSTNERYTARALVERPATAGTLAATLPAGVQGRLDRVNAVEVDLSFGSFASAEKLQVLAGANRIAVVHADGAVEVLSFLEAQETAGGRWRLTGLLRGLFGTEDVMAADAAAGDTVILLDDAPVSLGLEAGETGLALNWLAASDSDTAGPWTFAGGTRAATPLAPVHLGARRQLDGDISLTWIRRGRDNADSWDAYDIPLGEPEERYALDILSGTAALRSIEVAGPSYNYAAGDELVDFGAPQSSLSFRVRQIGWTVASGIAASATIAL